MCTVSWLPARDAGYHLFFNRDERRTRGPEIGPSVHESRGVRILAPQDADFGGTWIATNELGLTVCILNGYGRPNHAEHEFTSRGLLVSSLADASSVEAVSTRLSAADLSAYRPFVLAALTPAAQALVVEWDGQSRLEDRRADRRVPLISSAFSQSDVRVRRSAAFRELAERTPDHVEAFHRGHAGGRGPYSPCMHREDAATRSMTRIDVGPVTVELRHTPGPPCRTPAGPVLSLPRRVVRAAPR